MITIATFDSPTEAHIALGRLQAEGIPCMLADEYMGNYGMPASIAVGGIKLKVEPELAQRALEVLASDRSADVE
jgi:hypothetical protein